MKKILSILFALLIILSGMHLSIATHLCGGEIAASKVSFSGGPASCGMEVPGGNCSSQGSELDSNCCKNKVSVFAVDSNYAPSFTEFNSFSQNILQVFVLPVCPTIHSLSAINGTSSDVGPPGNNLATAVSLPKICVFRI
ncbi:MAG: hypothetical protein Q7W54_09655 [Bacteroidota bacterium]|nr:hypothetical protein [Bacteroidota bacterium]